MCVGVRWVFGVVRLEHPYTEMVAYIKLPTAQLGVGSLLWVLDGFVGVLA